MGMGSRAPYALFGMSLLFTLELGRPEVQRRRSRRRDAQDSIRGGYPLQAEVRSTVGTNEGPGAASSAQVAELGTRSFAESGQVLRSTQECATGYDVSACAWFGPKRAHASVAGVPALEWARSIKI